MIKAIVVLLAVILLAMLVFFTASLFVVSRSKKTEATLCRFEKAGNGKSERAVYLADGEEYPNIFPAEQIMRSRIYKAGGCRVRIVRFAKRAYAIDRHTMLIIFCGYPLSLISLALLIFTAVLTGVI